MRIRREHDFGVEEAKRRIDQVARDLADQFSLRSDWRGDTLAFRGSGINGQVAVAHDSIEFNVKLGLALMMMERPIRNAIEKALDEQLNSFQ